MSKVEFKKRCIFLFNVMVAYLIIANQVYTNSHSVINSIGQAISTYVIPFVLTRHWSKSFSLAFVTCAFLISSCVVIVLICYFGFKDWATGTDYSKERKLVVKTLKSVIIIKNNEIAEKIISVIEKVISKIAEKLYNPAKQIYHFCQIEQPKLSQYKFIQTEKEPLFKSFDNKPIAVKRNGEIIARVIVTKTDMAGVDNPQHDVYNLGNLLFFGAYSQLSDDQFHHGPYIEADNIGNAIQQLSNVESCFLLLHAEEIAGSSGLFEIVQVENVAEANGIIYCIRDITNENPFYMDAWNELTHISLEAELRTFSLYMAAKVYNIAVEYWCGKRGEAEEHLEDGEGFRNLYDYYFLNEFLDLNDPKDCQYLKDMVLQVEKAT